jgi:hypothetical protein
MDCLRQFQFYISQARTFTAASNEYDYFGTVFSTNFPYNVKLTGQFVNFAIQGFKNVDIYGVEMLGFVQSPMVTAFAGTVEDYSFQIGIAGQNPQISGVITTNNYNAVVNNNTIQLSKWNNKIMFAEPIKSATSLSISTFQATGYGAEDALQIQMQLEVQLYFYYKFEGE